MNSLHHGPDNAQTACLCSEGVNLIGASSHIAKEAFNRIGTANMSMHCLREIIKGQEMLFVFAQTAHRLWIALTVLAFEGCQFCQCLLFCGLVPDPAQFGGNRIPFTLG